MESGMDAERSFLLQFIKLYKSLPSLWKVKSKEYINRAIKNRDYDVLVEKMKERYPEATKQMVIKKINVMRTSYRRELRKKKTAGEDEEYVPTLWYFNYLKFLDDQEERGTEKSTNGDEIENWESQPRPKKKKICSSTDELVRLATQRLKMPQDSCHQIGIVWGNKLSKMDRNQRIIAERVVNEVMFNGELGLLSFNTALTNISSLCDFNPSSPSFSKNNTVTDNSESSPESPPPQNNYIVVTEYDPLDNSIKIED